MSKHDSRFAQVRVELADTPHSREKGLMFRDKLDDGHGMAFVFEKPGLHSFWGMNTLIPLDIAFVNDNNKIVSTGRIKPHDLTSVASSRPCSMAVELPDGWLSSNGFREGDECHLERDGEPICIFVKSMKIAQVQEIDAVESDIPKVSAEDISEAEEDPITTETRPAPKPPIDVKKRPDISITDVRQSTDPSPSQITPPIFTNMKDALNWAIGNNQTMLIEYMTQKGNIIKREIEPHGMHFSENSRRQVVVCWDEIMGSPRNYFMMKILRYSFPGRTFNKKFVVA